MYLTSAERAKNYYQLMGEKKAEEVKKYLHQDVELIGPMGSLKGKDAVFQATCNFMNMVESLTVRAYFGKDLQAMVVHSSNIPGVAEGFSGAVLLQFDGDLIVRKELFYDASLFLAKKEEIFS